MHRLGKSRLLREEIRDDVFWPCVRCSSVIVKVFSNVVCLLHIMCDIFINSIVKENEEDETTDDQNHQ